MTRLSLRGQRLALILAFISMAAIPVLLLSIPLFAEVRKLLQAGAEHELTLEAETIAGRIDTELEATLSHALPLASEGDIQRASRAPLFKPRAERDFRSFFRNSHLASALYLVDARGNQIASAAPGIGPGTGARFRRAITETCLAFRGDQSGFSQFYVDPGDRDASNDHSIMLSIPVFNPRLDVWSGALCIVLPWKNVLRAALSRITPQPILSDILLDGKPLLHPLPERPEPRELVKASVPLNCPLFGVDEGRLSVQVAETRMLWLTKFYNTLASFALIATTLVALIGWMAFWLLKKAMSEAEETRPKSGRHGGQESPRKGAVLVQLPRHRND